MLANTNDSWGSVSKTLHWAIGLMIIMQLGAGMLMVKLANNPWKMKVYDLHKSTGTVIFILVILRLMWRLGTVIPSQPASLGIYHHYLQKLSYFTLYACMIIMPLSGFVMSDAAQKPVTLYHFYTLPHLFPANPQLSHNARLVHHYTAYGFTGILVLHFCASLYHHYVLRNDILKRMLPDKICRKISPS